MNQKVRFPYWLIIILLAAFAVGYWVWTESLRDQYYESSITHHGKTSAPSSDGTTGEYAGWKTYRNEEYKVEFKYPLSWYTSCYSFQRVNTCYAADQDISNMYSFYYEEDTCVFKIEVSVKDGTPKTQLLNNYSENSEKRILCRNNLNQILSTFRFIR